MAVSVSFKTAENRFTAAKHERGIQPSAEYRLSSSGVVWALIFFKQDTWVFALYLADGDHWEDTSFPSANKAREHFLTYCQKDLLESMDSNKTGGFIIY